MNTRMTVLSSRLLKERFSRNNAANFILGTSRKPANGDIGLGVLTSGVSEQRHALERGRPSSALA